MVFHIYDECARLERVLCLVWEWGMVLSSKNSHALFIDGHKYSVSKNKQAVLQNVSLGKAKTAIWLTQRNREVGLGVLVSVDAPYLQSSLYGTRTGVALESHIHGLPDSPRNPPKILDSNSSIRDLWTTRGCQMPSWKWQSEQCHSQWLFLNDLYGIMWIVAKKCKKGFQDKLALVITYKISKGSNNYCSHCIGQVRLVLTPWYEENPWAINSINLVDSCQGRSEGTHGSISLSGIVKLSLAWCSRYCVRVRYWLRFWALMMPFEFWTLASLASDYILFIAAYFAFPSRRGAQTNPAPGTVVYGKPFYHLIDINTIVSH